MIPSYFTDSSNYNFCLHCLIEGPLLAEVICHGKQIQALNLMWLTLQLLWPTFVATLLKKWVILACCEFAAEITYCVFKLSCNKSFLKTNKKKNYFVNIKHIFSSSTGGKIRYRIKKYETIPSPSYHTHSLRGTQPHPRTYTLERHTQPLYTMNKSLETVRLPLIHNWTKGQAKQRVVWGACVPSLLH